jgi:adenosylmethionine-8-amino-7-oxononanoate aminotransferase
VKEEAFARGMACYPMGGTIDGCWGDHVLLAPPYIITAGEVDRIVDILGDAVDAAVAVAI